MKILINLQAGDLYGDEDGPPDNLGDTYSEVSYDMYEYYCFEDSGLFVTEIQ